MSLITINPPSLNHKRVFQPVPPKTLPYLRCVAHHHHFSTIRMILNHNTENSTIYTFNQTHSAFNHCPSHAHQTHTPPFSTIDKKNHSTISGRDAPDLANFSIILATRRALNPSWLRHLNHGVEHHRSVPMVEQYELWLDRPNHDFELSTMVWMVLAIPWWNKASYGYADQFNCRPRFDG